MNEIKRQLDQKIGNTKDRANHLITKINKEKRQINRNKKSPARIPYFLTLGSFAILMALFVLINPFDLFQETTSDDSIEEPALVTDDLKSYFRKSGDVSYYEGIGSDIATYKVETSWLSEHYVQHLITNDGALVQRIFRITENEIQLIYNQEINEPPISFDSDELDQLPTIDILLKTPLKDGHTFEGKTVSFPETVDTPIGSFDNAVKISEQMEDGVNDIYYVPNEGMVKTVYSFDDGGEVTSVLRSVVTDDIQSFKTYFRKTGDVAYFVGKGNEFASYKLETTWLDEHYIQTVIDNGGGITQEIYRITANEIQLIYNEIIESIPIQFELNDLEKLPVISVILQGPLENGKTFNGKTISLPEVVETPIGIFENAVKVSEQYDGGINHTYYVPNEGIVKRVHSFNDGGEVISELSSVVNENPYTLKSFFRQSGDVAYYIGRGYAHASYSLETTWLAENYVQTIDVNDNTTIQSIYRITENEIQLVYNGNAEQNTVQFELTELDQLPVISVVLKTPLENGEEFNGKTISMPETVGTPIGSFDNAIKVSEKSGESTIHTYYVPNEGLVKEVFAHDSGGEIVRLLASIGSPPKPTNVSDLPDSITAIDSTTNTRKTIILNEHPMLQQILIDRVGFEDINKVPFTYTPYDTEDGSSKYGVLQSDCAKETCYLLFVKETEEKSQSLLIGFGKPDQLLKISPDGNKAMLGIQSYEYDSEDSRVSRNQIALIDLQTFEQIYPSRFEQYFDSTIWPILEYEWLDAKTLQIMKADIENHEHKTIAEWEKLENAPVKELKITIQ